MTQKIENHLSTVRPKGPVKIYLRITFNLDKYERQELAPRTGLAPLMLIFQTSPNVSNFAGLVWKANFEHFFGNILGLITYFSKPIFALKP